MCQERSASDVRMRRINELCEWVEEQEEREKLGLETTERPEVCSCFPRFFDQVFLKASDTGPRKSIRITTFPIKI